MNDGEISQHPTDRLIRELLRTGRQATDEEITRIVECIATAPFDPQTVRVRPAHRGAGYQDRTLGVAAPSLTYHLVKRVVLGQQWAAGTTADQYVEDLRRAALNPSARLAIYQRRGGHIAAVVAPTDRVLPAERRGARPEPNLLVVYSADRGIILSGYQFSTLDKTGVPREARWLR